MDFPMDFWLFRKCFVNVLLKVITNLKFYKCCFIKEAFLYHRMMSCALKKTTG
jgi:hypothetical protein